MRIPMLHPTRFEMQVLGVIHRILKSAIFNVLMALLGFGIGMFSMALDVHYRAMQTTQYESVLRIQSLLGELQDYDAKYSQKQQELKNVLESMRINLGHGECPIDKIFNCPTK